MLELAKLTLSLLGYCVAAPVLGLLLRHRRRQQRAVLGAMILLTAVPTGYYGISLYDQSYRGHVRGFEVSLIGILALALLVARALESATAVRRVPAEALAFALYGLACSLSVLNAVSVFFWATALFKHATLVLVLLAAWHVVRGERDLRAVVDAMAVALIVEGALVFVEYAGGRYRTYGGFGHSNSMAMWAYWLGLLVLSCLLFTHQSRLRTQVWLGGVICAYLAVVLSVSRASIAAIGAGTVALLGLALLRRPTTRNALLAVCLVLVVIAFGAKSFDTISARFVQHGGDVEVEDFRDLLVRQAQAMFSDHRWLGVGWNNYGLRNSRPFGLEYSAFVEQWSASKGHRIIPENFRRNSLPENIYWLQLAETGLVGFAGFLLFLLVAARAVVRRRRGQPLSSAVRLGLATVMTITLAHGTLERVMGQTKNLTVLVLVLGAFTHKRGWQVGAPPPRPAPTQGSTAGRGARRGVRARVVGVPQP